MKREVVELWGSVCHEQRALRNREVRGSWKSLSVAGKQGASAAEP